MSECPVCKKPIPIGMLACRNHWLSLPADIRNEVNRAWSARLRDPNPRTAGAHDQAKAKAQKWWDSHL